MTPGELRRRATQQRAAADEMAADADRLRVQAAALQGLLAPLVSISQRVWVGPAAADFEAKMRANSGVVDAQASRLRSIAADLERKAADARRSAATLDAEATVVEAAAAVAANSAVIGGVI
jgi:uncharacterized protein YukE